MTPKHRESAPLTWVKYKYLVHSAIISRNSMLITFGCVINFGDFRINYIWPGRRQFL